MSILTFTSLFLVKTHLNYIFRLTQQFLFVLKVVAPFYRLQYSTKDSSEDSLKATEEFFHGLEWMEKELVKRGAFLFGGRWDKEVENRTLRSKVQFFSIKDPA